MRYALVVFGFVSLSIGVLLSSRDARALWILCGVFSIVIGVATCEIVTAIQKNGNTQGYKENLRQFQNAVERGDEAAAAAVLTRNRIDKELANSVASSVISGR